MEIIVVEGLSRAVGKLAIWRRSLLALSLGLIFLISAEGASASPGDLDTTFGTDGTTSVAPDPGAQPVLRDVIRLPGGGMLVSGGSNPQQSGILARFEENGKPDRSFGDNGVVRTPHSLWARIVPVDGGKVVAFGRSGRNAAIARFNSDGSPDQSFGEGGLRILNLRVLFSETDSVLEARGAGVDSAGRPVAVVQMGACSLSDEGSVTHEVVNFADEFCGNAAVIRLTAGGEPDPTFGDGDGIRIFASPGGRMATELTPDDRILIASVAFSDSGDIDVPNEGWQFIQRLLPDGIPDPVFGEKGWAVFYDEGEYPMAGILQSDLEGRITVSFGGRLMRLLSNGKRDFSFGRRGVARVGLDGLAARNDMSLHLGEGVITGEHIFLAGSATHWRRSGGRSAVVVRLNKDGTPDPRFSNDGIAARKIGPFIKFSLLERRIGLNSGSLLVDQKGRPVVGATGGPAENLRFTLTRFKGGKTKRLTCGGELATVQGTSGDDELVAGRITATGAGDDIIQGGGKRICAGGGDDRVESWQAGTVLLGPGDDFFSANSIGYEIRGGPGNDRILGRNLVADGGSGDDLIDATRPKDSDWYVNEKRLVGGPGKDHLLSNWGKDRLYGGPGPDVLRSGLEEDRLFGGSGDDSLYGEQAADFLIGGPGNDRIDGGSPGPAYHRYWANNRKVRGLLEILPHRIGRENLKFRVSCQEFRGSTFKSWSTSSVIVKNLKIENGRFRGKKIFDSGGFGYDSFEKVSGKVTPRWITVTIEDFEEQVESTTCTARNFKFRLKRIRPLRQIVRP